MIITHLREICPHRLDLLVPDLGRPALLFHDYDFILVDADADLDEVVDWAIEQVADQFSSELLGR